MSDVNWIEVEWDGETYRREDNKRACTFEKLVSVQIDGESMTLKLSYTTEYLDETRTDKVLRPCVRISGERINLDDERILVAEESVVT